jgi:segregation and condensation protein B
MGPVSILEAVLFVAERPVPLTELCKVLETPIAEVERSLLDLGARLDETNSGLVLRSVAGGWRLYARPEAFKYIERFSTTVTAARLSQAALESLAVVAYKQPVSRAQVSSVRGVDSESSLRTLERRGLIEEFDRLSIPGNPAVYSTTELFLEMLALQDLEELPPLADHVPASGLVEKFEETFRPSE